MKLTEQAVKRLAAKDQQVDYWDADVGNGVELALRVGPRSKTWAMRYRLPDGRRRRLKLGYWVPAARSGHGGDFDAARVEPGNTPLTIAQARAVARAQSGKDDPQAERLQRRHSARESRGRTVEALVGDFLAYQEEQGVKSRGEQARMLMKDVKPLLWATPVVEVTRSNVEQVLERIKTRGKRREAKHGGLVAANRMKSLLVQLFNFAVDDRRWRQHVQSNPAAAVRRPLRNEQNKIARDRVLTDKEVKALWLAAGQLHPVVCGAFRFRLATGQRQTEILGAQWAEFQSEPLEDPGHEVTAWHIPKVRTELILEELRPLSGADKYVFASPRRPGHPIGRVNRSFRRWALLAQVEDFKGTDIRRTVNTNLARLRVRHEVKMAVMNHAPADVNKRHYDRYDYFAEKLDGLQRWNDYLKRLVSGESAKVVSIEGRR
jgi:integrase